MTVAPQPRPALDLGSGLPEEHAPSLVLATVGFLTTTALMSAVMMLFSLI